MQFVETLSVLGIETHAIFSQIIFLLENALISGIEINKELVPLSICKSSNNT